MKRSLRPLTLAGVATSGAVFAVLVGISGARVAAQLVGGGAKTPAPATKPADTKKYEFQPGGFSVRVPEAWKRDHSEESRTALILRREGDAFVRMVVGSEDAVGEPTGTDADLDACVAEFRKTVRIDDPDAVFEPATPTTFAGLRARSIRFVSSSQGRKFQYVQVLALRKDKLVTALYFADTPASLAKYMGERDAILSSMEFKN